MARLINVRKPPQKAVAPITEATPRVDAGAVEIAQLRVSIGELEQVVEQLVNREPEERVVETQTETIVREIPVVQETIVLEDPRFTKLAADMGAMEKTLEQIKKKKPENVVVYGGNNVTTGGGGGITDGDKGDIVVSSSGATWTLDPSVVTAAGRALIDDANAGAQRTTLGLQGSGVGLAPAGGSTTQVLAKLSNSDYDYAWASAGAGGGGTQYAEDTVAASGDLGDLVLAVRRDSDGTQVSADGDYSEIQVDASGFLKTIDKRSVYPSSQSGAWSVSAAAAFPVTDNSGSLTIDAPVGTPVFVRLSDGASPISALPVTDNAGSLTVDNAGTFAVQAAQSGSWSVAAASAFPVTDNAGSLTVDNAGTFAVQAASTQSGTWTVQPGNTANTTAWLVTGTGGTFPVTDSGGSLTVDNAGTFAVQAAQSGTWSVRNQDGSGNALTSAARGSERAMSVQIVDASGAQITSFGGASATVTEDAASVGGEAGPLSMTVRQDTIASSTSADGDYQNLKTDSVGRLYVNGSGVTQPVSGTVAATQSGNWSTRTQDGSGNAITSATRGSERAMTVQIVDGTGTQVTSFGGSGTPSAVSTANSSATPLGGSAAFTGTSEDVTAYSSITVSVISDVASATDGLSMQQSSNGTNWDITDVYTIPAATGKTFAVQVAAKFFRLVYTNGAGAQASFRLQTMYHTNMQVTSSIRPQDARTNDNDMQETVSYLAGYNGTTWDRLRTTGTGVLTVSAAVTSVPSNQSVNVSQINAVTPLMGNGVTGTGSQRVTIASDNTAFSVNSTLKPATTGGLTTHHLVSAASTNATVVKASAGQLYGWYIYNSNAAARKVAFHNASATPTAGASIFFTMVIPPTSGANVFSDIGIPFSTGIAYTTVTDLTDAGATAVAASDLIINLFYT